MNLERTVASNPTLDQFAEYCWSILPVTKKTIQNYRGAYSRNISRYLGSREMDAIAKREFIDILAPLTPQNQFQTLMVIRVLYREALARELVDHSPVAQIKAPRIRIEPKKFLTWEQVRDTHFGKYDCQIRFLALHGLRWSEAVALTQDDIKDTKVIVNKSTHGVTKSPAGVREVPYLGYFSKFPRSRHAIAKTLSSHGVTIHSLRKTYAYLLKTRGIHVTTAAKLLGHSNPMITLKIYTLVRDDEVSLVRESVLHSL